jgi:hypothetical protein
MYAADTSILYPVFDRILFIILASVPQYFYHVHAVYHNAFRPLSLGTFR